MKKTTQKILTVIGYLLIVVLCYTNSNFIQAESNQSSNQSNFDFRQTNWGMTQTEVINSEKSKPIANQNNQLLFLTNITNRDSILFYSFQNNNTLESAGYIFNIHSNMNDYIQEYKDIKELLIKKYGQPKVSKLDWKNDLFKYDPLSWNLAVSIGDLQLTSIWETENTQISLSLFGDNFKVTLGIMYKDKNFDFKNDCNIAAETEGL